MEVSGWILLAIRGRIRDVVDVVESQTKSVHQARTDDMGIAQHRAARLHGPIAGVVTSSVGNSGKHRALETTLLAERESFEELNFG